MTSLSLTDDRVDQLRLLFPEAFSEGLVDFEKLRLLLGDAVDTGPERYGLSWAGKAEVFQSLRIPATGTLRPCPEESVNFESSENLIIEGDNLEVLKLLQKSYYGKVKMIYIDPPYNTGNDFIYKDDFRDGLNNYLRFSGQMDDEGNATTSDKEKSGRLHSNWLNMMYPRLYLARNLLRDDGVIFVSIDEIEIQNLKFLLDEVYGAENHVGTICWKNVTDNNPTLINSEHEYIICYAKVKSTLPQSWKSTESEAKDLLLDLYARLKADGNSDEAIQSELRRFISDNEEIVGFLTRYKNVDANGIYTGSESVHNTKAGGYDFEIIHPVTNKEMRKPANGYRFPPDTFKEMDRNKSIIYGEDENRIIKIKKYLRDYEDTFRSVVAMDGRLGSYDLSRLFNEKLFNNPKPVDLLKKLISFVCDKDSLILDFFGGSGTTSEATLRLNEADGGNRKYILVQLPEKTDKPEYPTIAHITRERVRRVIKKIETARTEATAQPDMLEAGNAEKPALGFRALRLASSNFRLWDSNKTTDTTQLTEQLDLHVDNVDAARSEQDILFEIILKAGLSLSANITAQPFAAQHAFMVNDGEQQLLVCLASPIAQATLDAMRAAKPKRIVCLDNAFAGNDALKTNTVLQMRDAGIHFRTV